MNANTTVTLYTKTNLGYDPLDCNVIDYSPSENGLTIECAEVDRLITLVEASQLRIESLKTMLTDTLDWLENAPFNYSNGNVHNGLDEGDVIGGRMHDELVKKIKTVLAH